MASLNLPKTGTYWFIETNRNSKYWQGRLQAHNGSCCKWRISPPLLTVTFQIPQLLTCSSELYNILFYWVGTSVNIAPVTCLTSTGCGYFFLEPPSPPPLLATSPTRHLKSKFYSLSSSLPLSVQAVSTCILYWTPVRVGQVCLVQTKCLMSNISSFNFLCVNSDGCRLILKWRNLPRKFCKSSLDVLNKDLQSTASLRPWSILSSIIGLTQHTSSANVLWNKLNQSCWYHYQKRQYADMLNCTSAMIFRQYDTDDTNYDITPPTVDMLIFNRQESLY